MNKGAYFLGIELDCPLELAIPRFVAQLLEPAFYVYCGSAYGPGGLDARLKRHLKKRKKLRWHVDRLTTRGRVSVVGRVPGGNECDLRRRFSALSGTLVPIPGFGSSDCKDCPSHLLKVDEAALRAHLADETMVEYLT